MSDQVEHGETCQRCGEAGEDRRTLWMACFYAMSELGLPFEQVKLQGTLHAYEGEVPLELTDWTLPKYSTEPAGPVTGREFYTLRVCKACRASWMAAIETWFRTPDAPAKGCGSGIFIRERGAVREITLAEWERLQADKGRQ